MFKRRCNINLNLPCWLQWDNVLASLSSKCSRNYLIPDETPNSRWGQQKGHKFDIKMANQGGWIPKWDETFNQCPNIKSACHHFLLFTSIQSLVLCDFQIKLKVQCRRVADTDRQMELLRDLPPFKSPGELIMNISDKTRLFHILFLHSQVFFPLFLDHSLLTLEVGLYAKPTSSFVGQKFRVEKHSCQVVINNVWCHLRDNHRWHF